MVSRRRERGYSLIEITVTLAIFGIFLYIIVMLTAEMRRNEKKWPVDFMTHPDVSAVVARLRRDIEDTRYFPQQIGTYTPSAQVLLLYTHMESGFGATVVYDFTTAGEVHRIEFTGPQPTMQWVAHGVPTFRAELADVSGEDAVHITATDSNGRLAIDQTIVPRAHN